MDTELNMSQQHALTANGTLGCIRQTIASGLREAILPLSTDEVSPEVLCTVLRNPVQERHGHIGRVIQTATKMMKGLSFYEERLRQLGLFRQKKV